MLCPWLNLVRGTTPSPTGGLCYRRTQEEAAEKEQRRALFMKQPSKGSAAGAAAAQRAAPQARLWLAPGSVTAVS